MIVVVGAGLAGLQTVVALRDQGYAGPLTLLGAEDESLLTYLAEKCIPVELCPISNVRTGVVASIADHPARRYFDLGLRLSVNTDDPQMFGNSLADEYRALETQLGFSRDEIRALILQAVDTSWLPPARKRIRAIERSLGLNGSPPDLTPGQAKAAVKALM